ncbi:MAG: hypothetical protein HQK53_11040 [Oligoflexia bacterium]|nr:hypothetical protein [Oligoflexia bacterium]
MKRMLLVVSFLLCSFSVHANLIGQWRANVDGMLLVVNYDNNRSFNGTLSHGGFYHFFQGDYNGPNFAMGTIKRTNLVTGCVTIMYTTFSISLYQVVAQINGTDGRCDLGSGFSSTVTYTRLTPPIY